MRLPWTKVSSIDAAQEVRKFGEGMADRNIAWQEKTGKPGTERPDFQADMARFEELQAEADEARQRERAEWSKETATADREREKMR